MTFHTPPRDYALADLSTRLGSLSLTDRLVALREAIAGPLVFTTSFGLEDQALTHAVVGAGIDVAFLTLDTGRLFDETLELWAETEMRYGLAIRAFGPNDDSVQSLIARGGPLGFRHSVEARHDCCGIRKVEPLGRALAGASGWLTGLRSGQSAVRVATPFATFDPVHEVTKLSPLADWSRERLED